MDATKIKKHLWDTGWIPDSKGRYHLQKQIKAPDGVHMRNFRVKFNKLSITIEMLSTAGAFYIRIGGAPYDAIIRRPDGGLQVISYIFPIS